MSAQPGQAFVLDAEEVTLVDVGSVTQGSGEDAESWPVLLIDAGGRSMLIEEYEGVHTLYEPFDGSLSDVRVTEESVVDLAWEASGESVEGPYTEGVTSAGDSVLGLPTSVWIEVDTLVTYGPQDGWRCRIHTPASELRRHDVEAPGQGQLPGAGKDLGLALALPLYAAGALFVGVPHFDRVWWTCGILALMGAGCSRYNAFHRTARLWAFAFGLWLLTDITRHLAPPALSEPWGTGRALFLLLAALPPFFLHRRTFHAVTDAAVRAAWTSMVLFTIGLLLVALVDEDLSWMGDWSHYFAGSPWGWMWPLIGVAWLRSTYLDYKHAPLDGAAFWALKDRVVARLRDGSFLDDLEATGKDVDDLEDGLRLCDDVAVLALGGHASALTAAAKALEGASEACGERLSELSDDEVQVVRSDGRTLADDIESMGPSSSALRVSPLLRFKVAGKS